MKLTIDEEKTKPTIPTKATNRLKDKELQADPLKRDDKMPLPASLTNVAGHEVTKTKIDTLD
jgi:hypothetical protein